MKKKEPNKKQEVVKKPKGLFEHLNALTASDKNYFKKLSDVEKKSFSTYMINRFLSMHSELIEIVNYFQRFNNSLDSEIVFKLYYDILPKKKLWSKYIKSIHEVKYNSELIDFITKHYRISISDAKDYLRIYMANDIHKTNLIHLLQSYGYDLQKIQELVK
jgi:hypothetical protein